MLPKTRSLPTVWPPLSLLPLMKNTRLLHRVCIRNTSYATQPNFLPGPVLSAAHHEIRVLARRSMGNV